MNFFQRLAKFKFSLMFVVLMAVVMIANTEQCVYHEPPVIMIGFLSAITIITLYVENKTEECK